MCARVLLLEQPQRGDGSVRGLPAPGCVHAALEEHWGSFYTPVPARVRHDPPAHSLGPFPMAPVTPPFAREPGPVQECGKAALPQAGTSPEGGGTSVPGSRRAAGCRPSRQSTISPFPPLSGAESRSPAVLINGRSGKQRGLAAAPGCAELAGAAARLPAVPVPVPARSQPAGRRARRQLCPQLCPQLDLLARLAPLGQGVSSRSSEGGMRCKDMTGMLNARMAWAVVGHRELSGNTPWAAAQPGPGTERNGGGR